MRVAWRHVDFNLHMNYAAYLEAMEVGRWDWVARAGQLPGWLYRRLRPLIGSLDIQYRKELRPFARYELETSVVDFDRRAIVFVQVFRIGEIEHASARVNVLVQGPGGLLTAEELREPLPESLRP